jgi:hypothetical protein
MNSRPNIIFNNANKEKNYTNDIKKIRYKGIATGEYD